MRTALLICALVFLCAAKPVFRDCEVTGYELQGHGYRIGGGLVLTCNHIICNAGTCALICDVNGHEASVVQSGHGGDSNSPDDDGCDWALLYVDDYRNDAPCELRMPVEGEQLTYRRNHVKVRAVSSGGYTGFDGDRPVLGDSGSGVTDKAGALCGLITTRMNHPGKGDAVGYFCCINSEIQDAVNAAREVYP